MRENRQFVVAIIFAENSVYGLNARIANNAREFAHTPTVTPKSIALNIQTNKKLLHGRTSSVTRKQRLRLRFLIDNLKIILNRKWKSLR
jgi:hypothetical protein